MIWDRNIDIIEGKRAKIYCSNGKTYTGTGIGDCLATNDYGEDEDGLRFETDTGECLLFIESDIISYELLD